MFWWQPVATATNRSFKSSNEDNCQVYLTAVKKYWSQHNLLRRIGALDSIYMIKADIASAWEEQDQDLGREIEGSSLCMPTLAMAQENVGLQYRI